MEYHGIIPDVIETGPEDVCQVVYSYDKSIFCGNLITAGQVKHQPTVTWDAEKTTFYTLCMIDPDCPDRDEPKFRSRLHCLVVNIPGNDISQGDSLTEYLGCKASLNLHRYIFLVYRQKKKICLDEKQPKKNCVDDRACFSIKKFTEKYSLGSTNSW